MRLIDADAVPQEFWEYEFDGKWRGCTIKDLLDSQPTIDAEPIVRCKDCVFGQGFAWYACPMAGKVNPKNNDFCSRGERRTDATD